MLSLSVTILRIGHEKNKKTEDGENNQVVTYHNDRRVKIMESL